MGGIVRVMRRVGGGGVGDLADDEDDAEDAWRRRKGEEDRELKSIAFVRHRPPQRSTRSLPL